jgi:predicted DNA-binding transcriptional regulator AlpA
MSTNLLTIKDVQSITGKSYLTVYSYFTNGKIPGAFKMMSQWFVTNEDFNLYIESLKGK